MSIEEIVAQVRNFDCKHCVLTGGEPMIAKDIHALADDLRRGGSHITIETAATVPPEGIACDLASLSPKLSNSTPLSSATNGWQERHERTRFQPAVICDWIKNYNFQLKFVITNATDLSEAEDLLVAIGFPVPASKILLMPEGTTVEQLRRREESLIKICKKKGYRYCDRLQIHLFGNTRGT
jgi:7-carboxy-7-deazaguanine synthase